MSLRQSRKDRETTMAKIYFNAIRGVLQWGKAYNQTVPWSGGMLETSNPAFIEAAKGSPEFSSIEGEVVARDFITAQNLMMAPASYDGNSAGYGLPPGPANDSQVYPTGIPPKRLLQCQMCGETVHPDEYPDHIKFHGRVRAVAEERKPIATSKKAPAKAKAKAKAEPKPTKKAKPAAPAIPVQGLDAEAA